MTEEYKWYEDYDNVTALGHWLLDEQCFTAKELQSYYEKPWKWDDEWKEYQKEKNHANP